jgi:glycosyltransferase involved in cell wall biosynthesis
VIHYASNLGALATAPNSVFTVYDLMHRRRLRARDRVVGALLARGVRHAGRVVAISRQTGSDVAAAFPEVAARLEVVPLGMRRAPRRDVPRDHVLAFGGGGDPRKRVDLAIAAYGEYARTSPDPLPLVVLARAGLSEEQRLRLGDLGARIVESATAGEVEALMAGAGALVYPTAEEGFGLPILEAAEVSTPVVMDASARVSAEVIGSHCIRVASLEATDWADAIREAVTRGPVEAALSLPDWATVASRYAELYRAVER